METRHYFPPSKLRDIVRHAYDLSQPQGMGFLHYTPCGLSEAELDQICPTEPPAPRYPDWKSAQPWISLDYVKGRAVKLTIFIDNETLDGELFIVGPDWYDHSPQIFCELLKRAGITP